jgi:predicted dehydrogenase
MKTVRLGIVGLGNMGCAHARSVLAGKIPRCELAAVADSSPAALEAFPGVKGFTGAAGLIASGDVDAVLIATPHYSHTTIGIAALEAGLHVLVEKPISVHKADCERLIAAHRSKKQVFAAMFNQRTDPYYLKLHELIRTGQLGEIRRVNWTITNWFRTEAYYASGGWRATWAGEGGGVLLNQSPHQLDLWQWLFGMPQRMRAFCRLGRYHDIEVEDDVTAYMEYQNGATGVFITSTGEAPGTNRLEVAGEQGRVVIENDRFQFTRNEAAMSEFSRTSVHGFASPPVWNIEIPLTGHGGQHNEVLTNFVAAVLDKMPLIAPAAEGIHSVELANAMLLSSFTGRTVELPMDAKVYERLLKKNIASSKPRKKPAQSATLAADFAKSFR